MTQTISQEAIKELQDKYLGKKISIKDNLNRVWVGECNFIGNNQFFPSWELQVTIDRTPITNVKVKSIRLAK